MFIAASFIITKNLNEHRCPFVYKWIQNFYYIYTMEYYSAIRNTDYIKFLEKWMYLENIILSEVNQS